METPGLPASYPLTIPTAEQLSESEGKLLRLRVKQLICGSLNTVLATATHTADRHPDPLEGSMAGSWGLEIVEQPRARDAVDCGETDQGDVREIVLGNACGGKPGSRGSKAMLLSHA